jgi:methylglyoxal synthase
MDRYEEDYEEEFESDPRSDKLEVSWSNAPRGGNGMNDDEKIMLEVFTEIDKGNKGYLTRMELQKVIQELTSQHFEMNHIEVLYDEFDKNEDGKIDFPELKTCVKYINGTKKKRRMHSSFDLDELNITGHASQSYGTYESGVEAELTHVLDKVVQKSRRDSTILLKKIAKSIFPVRDILCIQDSNLDNIDESNIDNTINSIHSDGERFHRSTSINFDDLLGGSGSFEESFVAEEVNLYDPEFKAAFLPSEMRCLALVSHNGMKKTMREFVTANKNMLKKFRLTGTNSTMTMLREVFADEPEGTIVFGPACASGPLGGDAELVAHMVGGKIGGIIFFQDPMDSHPHQADIQCLVRQALVHNIVIADTPSSALMVVNCLRQALVGKGRPEMMPSFFFTLQSPSVEAYKAQQKAVVEAQKAQVRRMSQAPPAPGKFMNTRMSMAYPQPAPIEESET